MGSHNRMLMLYRLSSLDTTLSSSSIDLLNTRMHDLEAVQSSLKLGTQTLVGLDTISEDSITTDLGHIQDIEESGSRRLSLIGDITVPSNRASSRLKELLVGLIASSSVYNVELRVASGRARCWVDVVAAEVASPVLGFLQREIGEVLVAECHDLALGHIERELVLAGWSELAELHALDLRANGWCEIRYFGTGREEVL